MYTQGYLYPYSELDLELTVIRRPRNVLARVHGAAFFNPERKTANAEEVQST